MITTHYVLPGQGLSRATRVAVVADLHDAVPAALFPALRAAGPDLVCLPGDFLDRPGRTAAGLGFLRTCASLFPTYCSLGNHEAKAALPALSDRVAEAGAVLLDDRCIFAHGMWIGGLSTGWQTGAQQCNRRPTPPPDRAAIRALAEKPGFRLLLCHHPEYYDPYLKETDIPLILAGHAHGGQWQFFGRGIFAPGQGLFPRYTAGLYDGRLLVSRGLCQTRRYIPRIGNPRELLILDLWPA